MSQNIPNNGALAQQCVSCASAQRSKKHGSPTDPSDRSLVVLHPIYQCIGVHGHDESSSPPPAYIAVSAAGSMHHSPQTQLSHSPRQSLTFNLLSITYTMLLNTVAFLAVLGAVSAAPAPQTSPNPPVSYDGRQLRFNLQLNKCLTARKVEVGSELGV